MTRRAAAPGKLLLSGAYAVLHGAPALVCAVDRYAYASDVEGPSTAEVDAAFVAGERPSVDTRALRDGERKLGLGSSAAALVAALALRAAQRGEDVGADAARRAVFARAREIHARVQSGGSGVDVAASTFGGVLRYTTAGGAEPVMLPAEVVLEAFFSGVSARTSDLRARVDALRARDAAVHDARIADLAEAARRADEATRTGDARALVAAVAATGPGLAALGAASGAPIVPPAFAELDALARAEGAAFVPSGAGGGDVGLYVGMSAPSPSFVGAAERAGMKHLALAIDRRGVHLA